MDLTAAQIFQWLDRAKAGPISAILDHGVDTNLNSLMDDWSLTPDITGATFAAMALALADMDPSLKPAGAPDVPVYTYERAALPAAGADAGAAVDPARENVTIQVTRGGVAAAVGCPINIKHFLSAIIKASERARAWILDLAACNQIAPLDAGNIANYYASLGTHGISGSTLLPLVRYASSSLVKLIADNNIRNALTKSNFLKIHTSFSSTPDLMLRMKDTLGAWDTFMVSEAVWRLVYLARDRYWDAEANLAIPRRAVAMCMAYVEVNFEDIKKWRQGIAARASCDVGQYRNWVLIFKQINAIHREAAGLERATTMAELFGRVPAECRINPPERAPRPRRDAGGGSNGGGDGSDDGSDGPAPDGDVGGHAGAPDEVAEGGGVIDEHDVEEGGADAGHADDDLDEAGASGIVADDAPGDHGGARPKKTTKISGVFNDTGRLISDAYATVDMFQRGAPVAVYTIRYQEDGSVIHNRYPSESYEQIDVNYLYQDASKRLVYNEDDAFNAALKRYAPREPSKSWALGPEEAVTLVRDLDEDPSASATAALSKYSDTSVLPLTLGDETAASSDQWGISESTGGRSLAITGATPIMPTLAAHNDKRAPSSTKAGDPPQIMPKTFGRGKSPTAALTWPGKGSPTSDQSKGARDRAPKAPGKELYIPKPKSSSTPVDKGKLSASKSGGTDLRDASLMRGVIPEELPTLDE